MDCVALHSPELGEGVMCRHDGIGQSLGESATRTPQMLNKPSPKYSEPSRDIKAKAVFSLVALFAFAILLVRKCSTRIVKGPSVRWLAGVPPGGEGGEGGQERASGLLLLAEVCAMLSKADDRTSVPSLNDMPNLSAEARAPSHTAEGDPVGGVEAVKSGVQVEHAGGGAPLEFPPPQAATQVYPVSVSYFRPPLSESDLNNTPHLVPGLACSTWGLQPHDLLSKPRAQVAGCLASRIHWLLSRPVLTVNEQFSLLQQSRALLTSMCPMNVVYERKPLRVAERIGRLLFAVDALTRVNILFKDVIKPASWWTHLLDRLNIDFVYDWKTKGMKAQYFADECKATMKIYYGGGRPSVAKLNRLFSLLFDSFIEHHRQSKYYEVYMSSQERAATVVSLPRSGESHQEPAEVNSTEATRELLLLGGGLVKTRLPAGTVVPNQAEEGSEPEGTTSGGTGYAERLQYSGSGDTKHVGSSAGGHNRIFPAASRGSVQVLEEVAERGTDCGVDKFLQALCLANVPKSPPEGMEPWYITDNEIFASPNPYTTSRLSVRIHLLLSKGRLTDLECQCVLRLAKSLITALYPLTSVGCERQPRRVGDRVAKAVFAIDALYRVTTFAPAVTQPSIWWETLMKKINVAFPILWKKKGTRAECLVTECRKALNVYARGKRPATEDLSTLFRFWLKYFSQGSKQLFHMKLAEAVFSSDPELEKPCETGGGREAELLAAGDEYQALLEIMRRHTSAGWPMIAPDPSGGNSALMQE